MGTPLTNVPCRSTPRRLAFALALVVPAVATSATIAPRSVHAEDRQTLGADVKIELKQPNGKVVTHRTQLDEFDMDFNYKFKGADSEHEVLLNVKRDGDSKKNLIVKVGYDKDGVAIFAPFETEWTANKREFIKTDDGKYAIALTIKPKMVKLKDKGREDDDKIIPDDSDDPLGGL